AEEAPGPLPSLDARRGDVAQLGCNGFDLRRHQVHVRRLVPQPERRPVKVVVRDEPRMLTTAAAGELDAIDGRVERAGQLLEPATTPPSCSTSFRIASTVPPVASTSS